MKYRIKETIMLSFFDGNDQKDILTSDGIIETDGKTIWYSNETGRYESVTTSNLIKFLLEQNKIEIM